MLDYPLELLGRVLEARVRPARGDGAAGRDRVVRRISTDSRMVQPGDLFFAIRGERFDGHAFVADALAKGAAGAVVSEAWTPKPAGTGPLLQVADPLVALGALAAWHRSRYRVRVVAVTGSVGKTTTKDLIHAVLSKHWTTLKSPGNLNAEIGLPLTLFEIGAEHQAAVVELAMRGPGQIRYLARIARPEIAVITRIGLSHLELLGSQDAIAAAKAEILDFLPDGGTAVLNADDDYFGFLRERVPPGAGCLPFSLEEGARESVTGVYLGPGPEYPRTRPSAAGLGSRFVLRTPRVRQSHLAWLPLLGRHNVANAVAAAAAAHALGFSWTRICRGLAEARVSGMRMAVHHLEDDTLLLDDAYNASSPEAMIAAAEVLRETPGSRKIAVLGDMLELGPASDGAHREVGAAVAGVAPELFVTVGAKAALMGESAVSAGYPEERVLSCATTEEALEALQARRRAGDVILVKGSRGMAMERVVQGLREDQSA